MLARGKGAESALVRIGDFLRQASGWRRAGIAFVTGALSAFSFAPFEIFPLFLLAVAVLVLLIDGALETKRPMLSAFWVGWLWAFGQFLFGLYWVAYAFLVEAEAHAWQIPFVEIFLPGGLALFIALACAISARFWRPGPSRIFVLAIAYGAAEWVRGDILTGFPWNLPAYSWGASLGVLQSTALFGSYSLSLLTILFGASLAQLLSDGMRRWQLPAAMTALFATFWIGGEIRLATVHPVDVPGVRLRLVQPDVPQREKIQRRYWTRNWRQLVQLSLTPTRTPPTIIIWPEAAPPYVFTRVQGAMDQVAALTGNDRLLMTGAVRVFRKDDGRLGASNSFYIFGPGGVLLSTYDKFHLVPFGEYLPFANLLERLGVNQLVDVPEGFRAGDGPHTFVIPGAPPVGPLICYEIIFPGAVTAAERPGWIVNVTDDSWFGPSSGPYQHLLTAQVRAIEEGIPIARDANTGISAIIGPLGQVRAHLGLGQSGVVDSALPAAVPKTAFARFGDTGLVLMLFVLGFGAVSSRGETKAGRARKSFSRQLESR